MRDSGKTRKADFAYRHTLARSLVLAVILGFAGAGAAPAFAAPAPAAEEPANSGLAEITVTARRKEEKLETVPFAVTAFSAAALSAQDTKSLTDIAHNTPGFQFQQQAGGGSGRNDRTISNLTFRGLFLGNVSPVSQGGLVFLDGAPVINAQFPAMDDIARVEVLKGPQSVYFGRSTFTGAINFVTKDPGFEFGGHLKAMYGTYGSNEFSASLNVPVVKDVLAVRIAGSHVYKGGQYHNYANPNEVFGSQKTDSVSLDVLFKPTDALRIKGYFSYQLQDDGPPAQASIKPGEMNCNLGGTYGAYWCGTLPSSIAPSAISGNYGLTAYAQNQLIGNPNKYVTIFNPNFLQHGGMKREVWQADVRADYSFGNGMTATSITAMHSDKTGSILDLDFRDASTVANPYYGVIPGATANVWWLLEYQALVHDFSQEIRLTSKQDSRFRWTVGGNYFWTDYLSGVIYGINPYGGGFSATYAQANPQTPAIFGAAYFDVTPQLTISAEARYQWDKVRQASLSNSSGVALNPPVRFGKTYTSFSPRVTIDYKFTPSSTAYALWSRGYRPGGFNTALAIQSDTIKNQILATGGSIAYDQERLDNYEIGIKSRFWHNRASIRASAYYDQYRNGQISNSIPYYVTGSPTVNLLSVVQNIGAVDLKGVEIDGDLAPLPGLVLNGSFGLADSEIKSYVCLECQQEMGTTNATGHRLAGAPKWVWTLGAAYQHEIANDITGNIRIDYRHRGSQYVDNANLAKSQPDDQIDLRAGVKRHGLSVEAFVTNLFNERTYIGGQALDLIALSTSATYQNEIRLALPELRRVGIRASIDF